MKKEHNPDELPKFVLKKIERQRRLFDKLWLIDLQLEAFCERKGYDFEEFMTCSTTRRRAEGTKGVKEKQ